MDTEILSLIVAAITLLLALGAIAVMWGVMQQKVATLETALSELKRDTEKRCDKCSEDNKLKFSELYDSRNDHRTTLAVIQATMENMAKTIGGVDSKLDALLARKDA